MVIDSSSFAPPERTFSQVDTSPSLNQRGWGGYLPCERMIDLLARYQPLDREGRTEVYNFENCGRCDPTADIAKDGESFLVTKDTTT